MEDQLHRWTRVRPSSQQLRYVAAGLAFLVAILHLFHPEHGFLRLVQLVSVDAGLVLTHPRPAAFVLSGIAIIVGINLVVAGFPRRWMYALGIGLMATYVVGYFAWHLSGHGGFLPGRAPHYHGVQPHEAVVVHLTGDPWAAAAVVAELALLGVLVSLLRDPNGFGTDADQ